MATFVNPNKLATAQANGLLNDRYWVDRLLAMIVLEESNFVFGKLGVEYSIPMNAGTKTISLRRYLSLATSANGQGEILAEGVSPTPLTVEGQMVSGNIDEFGAYMEMTNWVDEINFDDIKQIYMPELARTAAEVKERNIMYKFSEASEYFVDKNGATNSSVDDLITEDVLTLKDIRKIVLSMKNYRRSGHTKFGGKPVIVVHANVMQDLLDDTDLEDKVLVPGNENSVIKSGTLQQYMLYGFYIIETQIAQVQKNSTGYYVYTSYVLGKEPYAVISLGNKGIKWLTTGFSAEKSDPLGQKATFGYRFWSGAKMIDPMAMTLVYSCSAYSASLADFSKDAWGRVAVQNADIPASIAVDATFELSLAVVPDTDTATITAVVKNAAGVTITVLPDKYTIVWTSADATKASVVSTGRLTALATGLVIDASTLITAEIKYFAPFELNAFAAPITDTCDIVVIA